MSNDNTDQIRYWNAEQGQKWKDNQHALDTIFSEITALLLSRAKIMPGETILDIGCGTGETTLEVAKRTGSSGHIIGIDVSSVLLSLAKQRSKENNLGNVEFLLADAQSYSFEDGMFDLVISRFGVMFFNDPYSAFKNIVGAVHQGGRMVFICWAPIENNPWFSIPKMAAVKQLGKPAPTDPRAPGPLAFDDEKYVQDILSTAGLKNIKIESQDLNISAKGSLADAVNLACSLGPATRIFKEKNGNEQDYKKILEEVNTEFKVYEASDGVYVPALVYLVSCER